MRLEMEHQYCSQNAPWEALEGKKIVLIGPDSPLKQAFMQNLMCLSGQRGIDFSVSGQMEDDDRGAYVFLFSGTEDGITMEGMDGLTAQFEMLSKILPASAVLVSDERVYGKCFGKPSARKENELGYVCHTAKADIPVQCMRYAEHLACRLAREEGLPIKVVRAKHGQHGEAVQAALEAAVRVLLCGEPGEIYNLPVPEGAGAVKEDVGEAGQPDEKGRQGAGGSPLSPMEIAVDSGKYRALCETSSVDK